MQLSIGLDIGGTKILALAHDGTRILGTREVPTPRDAGRLADTLSELTASLVDEHRGTLGGVGIGIPGFVGLDGVARQAPNLPAAIGLDLGDGLRNRFGVPVVVDNDANCAAWAAFRRDAPDAAALVAVTLGTGIGGGIVLDGRLFRGAHGFAGEPGHMVVATGGWACPCGQLGCWEMYASGNGLGRLARAAVADGRGGSLAAAAGEGGVVDGPLVGRLAGDGDPEALAVLDEYAGWVAVGLVALVNIVDPDVVVLGGGVAALGDALRVRVNSALGSYPTVRSGRSLDVRLVSLGPEAGALGAALLASETAFGADPPPPVG